MITLTTDYKRQSITEEFPTLEDALAAYADEACALWEEANAEEED